MQSYTHTGVLLIVLIFSSHLIGIDASIKANIKARRMTRQQHLTRDRARTKTRGFEDSKAVTVEDVLNVMMDDVCLVFTGDGNSQMEAAKEAARNCFKSPPPKPSGTCDATVTGDQKKACQAYNDCLVFIDATTVSKSTLDSMPPETDPGLVRIAKYDNDNDDDTTVTNFIQTRTGTSVVVVDDILAVAGTCIAIYKFINSLIAWFKPAELTESQQKTLNSWLDYAKVVIDIAKSKLTEYGTALTGYDASADVSKSIADDLARLDKTLAKLKKEVKTILGLMKQCKDERDREFSAGLTWGAVFSFGISYGVWWDLKNKRIESWHNDVMCGVEQLNPRISAVRAAMDALHADVSMKILSILRKTVAAPVWGS